MLYAITDRRPYRGGETERRARLLEQTAIWAAHGVDLIQLRETDLPVREQVEIARAMLRIVREAGARTRLLINGRPDVAMACGADGVHLTSHPDELTPAELRNVFAGGARQPYISVSCHTLQEVEAACRHSADSILFAPVFGKVIHDQGQSQMLPGSGLAMLEHACRVARPVPVFALGGVTAQNAAQCLHAGAAGVAAIRMMQGPPSHWLPFLGRSPHRKM